MQVLSHLHINCISELFVASVSVICRLSRECRYGLMYLFIERIVGRVENIELAHDSSSEQVSAGSNYDKHRPGFHCLCPVLYPDEQRAAC